jgi:acyl-CoA synthetase (AMP-forming)/AMP-acid ligase II
MIPEEFEFRDVLPRTATDKIDRPRLIAETRGAVGGNSER